MTFFNIPELTVDLLHFKNAKLVALHFQKKILVKIKTQKVYTIDILLRTFYFIQSRITQKNVYSKKTKMNFSSPCEFAQLANEYPTL